MLSSSTRATVAAATSISHRLRHVRGFSSQRMAIMAAASRSPTIHNTLSLRSSVPMMRALPQQPNQQHQQRRTLFIQTEETPNPESLKFLPGRAVLDNPDGTGYYATAQDKAEIARSPLVQELFKLEGVKSVYLGNDFVTVTKYAEATWQHLRLFVFEALMDFFATNQPVIKTASSELSDTTILDTDDEVVAMIKELLEARIRPAVQEDGGDIRFVGFDPETGIVSVKLAGSCVGCPSSSVTLKNGVENMMMHYIPEVTAVVSIEEEPEEGDGGKASQEAEPPKAKSYEERLAAAGIPFSD